MNAATKNQTQATLAPAAAPAVPDADLEVLGCDCLKPDCGKCWDNPRQTPDAPEYPGTLAGAYSDILSVLREIRAAQDSLALDVQSLREEVKAGAGLTQCSCVDQDTLAGIYRAIQAREAAAHPDMPEDAPDGPDSAQERERAIPAHVAADLASCHATGYADAGITAYTSHAAFMQRAGREGAPDKQVAFLIFLLARLNLSQAPATIRAALGSAIASGRASSPNMLAVVNRPRPAGSTPATHLGTLAWLAATPPGDQYCRYSLIMQRARTAESLYQEWDSNPGVGR